MFNIAKTEGDLSGHLIIPEFIEIKKLNINVGNSMLQEKEQWIKSSELRSRKQKHSFSVPFSLWEQCIREPISSLIIDT